MTELCELVHEWAALHCPALLEDDLLFDDLCRFLIQVIDYSILAARRQGYSEVHDAKRN